MATNRETISTPVFRLAFPNVFAPRTNELSGKEEYSFVMLFPKTADISAVKAAIAKAAKTTFPALFPAGAKWPDSLRKPIGDGDEKAAEWGEEFRGCWYIRASSQFKPAVVDQHGQDLLEESALYSGCYARAAISPYAYEKKGNKGVSVGFSGVQFVRDGEPTGGGAAAAKKAFAAAPLPEDEVGQGGSANPADDVF